jgi:hypothetical protein
LHLLAGRGDGNHIDWELEHNVEVWHVCKIGETSADLGQGLAALCDFERDLPTTLGLNSVVVDLRRADCIVRISTKGTEERSIGLGHMPEVLSQRAARDERTFMLQLRVRQMLSEHGEAGFDERNGQRHERASVLKGRTGWGASVLHRGR